MQHLEISSPHELLEATFRERRRRGWAAVAPELERYVNTQRWPSGVFLPEDLRNHVARRIRHPPWFPHWGFAVLMIGIGAFFHFICVGIMTDPSLTDVQEHVNALYIFYALDHADPSMPPDLMCDFELSLGLNLSKPMQVTVFANGTFLVVPSSLLGPRLSTTGDAAASSDTAAACQHACRCQQPSLTAPQKAQPDVAVPMEPLAGKLRSSSDCKLPDAGDGEKARLLGGSAV